jgi:hypothetical protein
LVNGYQHFRVTYCLHLQGKSWGNRLHHQIHCYENVTVRSVLWVEIFYGCICSCAYLSNVTVVWDRCYRPTHPCLYLQLSSHAQYVTEVMWTLRHFQAVVDTVTQEGQAKVSVKAEGCEGTYTVCPRS